MMAIGCDGSDIKMLSAESCEGNRQETFGEGSEDRTYLSPWQPERGPLTLPRAKTYRGSDLAARRWQGPVKGGRHTQGREVHLPAFHMQVSMTKLLYRNQCYWPCNIDIDVRVHMSTYIYA